LKDWNGLNEDERNFIKMVLAFFAASDGVVTENLAVRFMNDVQIAEVRAFYGFQIAIEGIHSECYSLLIDTYIKDDNEKMKLFEATNNYPCIAKKFNWAKKWLDDKRSSFAKRLVAFAIIEGIFFSSSFACIYWIKKRGLMPGLTFSNELISRDEALHTEFAVLLYSKIVKKLPKKKIVEIIQEAVEIEKEFITEAIPCRMIGMNAKLMKQYIEFVADRLSLQLGYDKIYNSSNPFDFMELISVESKVNFFERTNSEYALANKSIDKDIFEFNAEF
jgi:ribonucleotide reductase beta subunit family protein with ferritin-like domain